MHATPSASHRSFGHGSEPTPETGTGSTAAEAGIRPGIRAGVKARIEPWNDFLATSRGDWLALWRQQEALHDQSPAWMEAVAVARELDPNQSFVVTARDAAGVLCLVYPIKLKTRRKRWMTLSFIEPMQNDYSMYAEPLTSLEPAEAVATLMGALNAWHRTWHWLEIENLDGGGAVMAAWRHHAERQGRATRVVEGRRSPYMEHQGSLEDFISSKSKKFRKKVRGLVRDVADDPNVRVVFYQQPDELEYFYQQALIIETRSWKHANGSAITSHQWERVIYGELLRRLGQLGLVKGAILYFGEQPVAHSMELLHGDRVLGLKSSYDQAHASRSPGNMLMIYLLAHYFEAGCREYDFLGGDEPYKLEWSTTVRTRADLRIYGRGLVGSVLGALERRRVPKAVAAPTAASADADRPVQEDGVDVAPVPVRPPAVATPPAAHPEPITPTAAVDQKLPA